MVGKRLGHYEIGGPLGKGGMGEVYRARDRRLGREVALKLLPAEMAADGEHMQRFRREARTVAALNHPNIVMVFSIEEADGTHFMTMELVEGETLAEKIPSGGMALGTFLELAIPIADALAEAHDRGVVHRDLKPSNILVDPRGRIKIADFGLATVVDAEAEDVASDATTVGRSSTGQIVGTVPYMAPEQLEGRRLDRRSDIFSLGTVLYEMLTGRRPFAGDSRFAVMLAIAGDTPPPPSSLRPDVPRRLDVVIRRCLEKRPSARHQTAHELSRDLAAVREDVDSGTTLTRVDGSELRRAEGVVGDPGGDPSIAVLPFVNLGGDVEDDYFGDGLSEELLGTLAKIDGLKVPARTSSFRFRGAERDIRQIGRQLGVGTVLEGSIRRSGDRMRIAAQLISSADGYHLWSETYDRHLDDIFTVQDEVAAAIVEQLKIKLHEEREPATAGRYSGDRRAYEAYLKGRFHWYRRDQIGMQKALELFEAALAIDPDYAMARVGLADVYWTLATYMLAPPRPALAKARMEVARALELDRDLGEAHTTLAAIDMLEARWEEAESGFERVLEMRRGYGYAHAYYGMLLSVQLRVEEMSEQFRLALRVEPLSQYVFGLAALGNYLAERYEPAISYAESGLELDPGSVIGLWSLGLCQSAVGAHHQAIETLTLAMDVSGGSPVTTGLLAYVHGVAGNTERAREIGELAESKVAPAMRPYCFFSLPLALGDRATAHRMLGQGLDEGIPPHWVCFFGRPFPDLLARLGLPGGGEPAAARGRSYGRPTPRSAAGTRPPLVIRGSGVGECRSVPRPARPEPA